MRTIASNTPLRRLGRRSPPAGAGKSTKAFVAESRAYEGRGGTSAEAGGWGLVPAFMDRASGRVYPACYADGRPAPLHLLDGLPESLVVYRDQGGRVRTVKASVVAGFSARGRFYTREEVARLYHLRSSGRGLA